MTTTETAAPYVRRIDRDAYVRVVPGEITSGGHQYVIHLASRDDASDVQRGSYDFDCSWCYLGASHSIRAHRAAIRSREGDPT